MSPEKNWIWSQTLHWEKYLRPKSIPEALRILEDFQGRARIIAGGTDVLVLIRKKEMKPEVLVDITRIPGLDEIRLEDGMIRIGALVTHSQAAASPLIRGKAAALAEGASQVGSPQIRNLGTVAGNVVSGQPGADTTIPLLALNATVRIAKQDGERSVPLTEFFVDTGRTVVDSTREMVTGILVPVGEKEASVSLRVAKRKALALPILTASVVLSADLKRRRFDYARIALGPVAPVPFRAARAEKVLASATITDDIITEAAREAAREANPRSSLLRGSEAYRRALIANLVERGIHQGIQRLEGSHV